MSAEVLLLDGSVYNGILPYPSCLYHTGLGLSDLSFIAFDVARPFLGEDLPENVDPL